MLKLQDPVNWSINILNMTTLVNGLMICLMVMENKNGIKISIMKDDL
jgi:hypothetical protein